MTNSVKRGNRWLAWLFPRLENREPGLMGGQQNHLTMYDTILVGTDGSPSANRAIVHALDHAENYEADLHGIYVVDIQRFPEPALSSAELSTVECEDYGSDLLDDIGKRAGDLDITFVGECCHGLPHEEIISYADEIDADMIVLGFQGLSHRRGETIGSVTERVVRSAGRPVLVV